jgi:hypothetical protein
MFVQKKEIKKGKKERNRIRIRNRKKEKGNLFPPSAGPIPAQSSSLSRALISPPEAQHGPPPVPALGWAEIPPAQLAGKSLFFFHYFFLFSYIYAYIDILCTKNSINKL